MASMDQRLMLVHAHPDDETIGQGATMASYAARGTQVTLVTCTLGEEGEVLVPDLAHLAADKEDGLGEYRITELANAMKELGVTDHRFLGGPGRFRDSGMVWNEQGHAAAGEDVKDGTFWRADLLEASDLLVEIIREVRPQVLVTYDQFGGYGHPDHIQAHAITTAAVEAAGTTAYPETGEPWSTPKFYWTVTERSGLERGIAAISEFPENWRLPEPGELPSVEDTDVTTAIDVRGVIDAKARALSAHATQVTVAPSRAEFALSNNVVQPILTVEHFVLAAGALGPVGEDGRERDLFGGLHS
jgi:N-acetyl-1-D-myo-inositol-2-amino-2-deoxy-alpha-D-glucopyranoside deacetylase